MEKEKATKQINIRLTPSQYDVLVQSGKVYELSPSAFLKKLAVETKPVNPPKLPRVSKEQWREFMSEYMAQGRNLNQMAKTLNAISKNSFDQKAKKASNQIYHAIIEEQKKLRELIWSTLVK